MSHHTHDGPITESLEDYLETIYHLINEKKVARVKDIANIRNVRMASVTPAMKRLNDLGLIVYQQREYIELTEEGEKIARRVVARHTILRRFFSGFLNVSDEVAEKDACQVEHHLSDETVDQLVRLFEFIETCPEGREIQRLFHQCSTINPELEPCHEPCRRRERQRQMKESMQVTTLARLKPGEKGMVVQISANGALRQRLIDMGLLPHTEVEIERVAPSGDPIWIKMRGFDLSLRKQEAGGILVAKVVPVDN